MKEKKILIVADVNYMDLPEKAGLGKMYEFIIDTENYIYQTCLEISKVDKYIKDFQPHLILWHFNSYLYQQTLNMLMKLNQDKENKFHPLLLFIAPTDFNVLEFSSLVTETIDSKFDPITLLETIKSLF